MTKRIPVQFGETELKMLEDLETEFPEWKFTDNKSEKFKEVFKAGYRSIKRQEENAVARI